MKMAPDCVSVLSSYKNSGYGVPASQPLRVTSGIPPHRGHLWSAATQGERCRDPVPGVFDSRRST